MTEPLVQIHKLTKHFRLGIRDTVHAVDDVSFDIRPKEIVGLVGESGSGKSTLGKTIIGLHAKTAGSVTFAGRRLPFRFSTSHFRKFANRMQMIFQDPYSSLNPRMTVGEIIAEGPKLLGTKGRVKIKHETREWLERVGLNADHVSRYPHEFSGGQRQRIGIARALILEPDFVICDEPISALDVSVQAQVINLLGELKDSLGLTLLFIAHDLSMVRYVSDRIAVMYLGSLIELGPADEVFFNPKHPYTQVLIGSNPEPDPKFERSRTFTKIQGEIPSPVNIKPGCRFASRCPKVMDVCRKKAPELRNIAANGKERLVACYLYEDE
ncbi:MAG: ABC transporter ATP-binding protein [Gammaproteobacteria bacterium]|nr:ABC transporter ATP-binding protein [Gammaproteobacteria bacterium]